MDSEKKRIISIHEAWINAERRRDTEAMLDLCSEEIRIFAPGLPTIRGKNAFREFLQTPGDSIKAIEISNIHIEISGGFAYKTAGFLTHLDRSDGSGGVTFQGDHLWLLRREDSQWRIFCITWSVASSKEQTASL